MVGRRLEDVTLAALITASGGTPCIQVAIPEEVSCGDDYF